jgi:hypothetical protein
LKTDMTERWLNPNRRVLLCELALAVIVAVAGVLFGWRSGHGSGWQASGLLMIAGGAAAAVWILVQMTRPRIGYRDGQLLVNLRMGGAFTVPIRHVEVFFLGQSPAPLLGGAKWNSRVSTVVVRLSEAADQWSQRDVLPVLGKWNDGYITIYGTSCEPLDVQRVNQLNRRLREVQRSL